jgi:hypothetical protein
MDPAGVGPRLRERTDGLGDGRRAPEGRTLYSRSMRILSWYFSAAFLVVKAFRCLMPALSRQSARYFPHLIRMCPLVFSGGWYPGDRMQASFQLPLCLPSSCWTLRCGQPQDTMLFLCWEIAGFVKPSHVGKEKSAPPRPGGDALLNRKA